MPPWVGSGCRQTSVATGPGQRAAPARRRGRARRRCARSPAHAGLARQWCPDLAHRVPVPVLRGLVGRRGDPAPPRSWSGGPGCSSADAAPGLRCSRRCQHARCQCLRSAVPALGPGQATTCGMPAGISWSHPGQRYVLAEPAPGTGRTTQSPSGHDSVCSGPGAAERGPPADGYAGGSCWVAPHGRETTSGVLGTSDQPVACSPPGPRLPAG